MRIAEIFHSVQGEGILMGTPAVFVRTSGCNLRCTWCDTPYTSWNPEGETLSVDAIVEKVLGYGADYAVVTGGEPLLFEETVALTHKLAAAHRHITIETAGTLFLPVACDLMSISPKLANSTPYEREGGRWAARHESLRIQPAVLKRLMTCYEYQLKFVVEKLEDMAEILTLVRDLNADRRRVVLMPEGTNAALLRERGLWLVDVCRAHNFRYSPRLHVDLWGDRRGV